jgi:hypothetical protein
MKRLPDFIRTEAVFFYVALWPFGLTLIAGEPTKQIGELTADRIAQIAAWLPEKPAGFGHPINDRTYWSDPAVIARTSKDTTQAEKLLGQEFRAWDEKAYLDYFATGSRSRAEYMVWSRNKWMKPLVLAECCENKGRFLPLINKILESYASEPTWTYPYHDKDLKNFHGEEYDVDLRSATFGHEAAEALYLLGEKVDPAVRKHLEEAIQQRLFHPFLKGLSSPGKSCYWLGSKKYPVQNNWNCVCLAGVVGAAQAILPHKSDRALYIAAGEHYIQYYLNSIPSDGYCGEGVVYWGYGFGHLAILREEIVGATGGNLDLFSNPRIVDNALYGVRILIGPEAIPPFADCHFGTKPSPTLVSYCNTVMKLGLNIPPFDGFSKGGLDEILINATPCGTLLATPKKQDPLRFYFEKAGVLASRPSPGSPCKLGIGIKVGGNGSHSHNDIGSYEISIGNDEPAGDPGGPYYDSSTFSVHRYEHKILNSYGHPVPVIGGKLQILASDAKPSVLSTSFDTDHDEILMDIASAYDVTSLVKLTREMCYNRSGSGRVIIKDEAIFHEPTTFEDALITHGDWKQIDSKKILITMGSAKVLITINASAPFHFKPEKIDDQGVVFTRIGLVCDQPVKQVSMAMEFQPN